MKKIITLHARKCVFEKALGYACRLALPKKMLLTGILLTTVLMASFSQRTSVLSLADPGSVVILQQGLAHLSFQASDPDGLSFASLRYGGNNEVPSPFNKIDPPVPGLDQSITPNATQSYDVDHDPACAQTISTAVSIKIPGTVAQVCQGDVTLSSQAQVDAFNCEEIVGNLTISGNSISNLDGLATLKKG